MSVDKFNFPHMFFLPDLRQADDAWQPRVDVHRTQDGWLIKVELAGVRPDEIRSRCRRAYTASARGPGAMSTAIKGRAVTAWRSPTVASSESWNCPGFREPPRSRRRTSTGCCWYRIKTGGRS